MRLAHKLMLLAVMAIAAMAIAAPSAFAVGETEPLQDGTGSELQIRNETTGVVCPEVLPATHNPTGEFTTSGGCLVHGVVSALSQEGHVFGIEATISICDVEFDLRVNGTGNRGYFTHQELSGNASCTRRPCHYPNTPTASFEPPATANGAHNEAKPWKAFINERTGIERITALVCFEERHTLSLEPSANKRHCEITIPFTETEGGVATNHRYFLDGTPEINGTTSGGQRCESDGDVDIEMVQSGAAEAPGRAHIEINHV